MKKTLAFIVLVALLVNCTHTIPHYFDYERKRPIVISERVGETIEPDEREQFDLFHGIDEFKAAIFYSISGGGYEVEILTENKRLAAVNRDSLAITVLRDYINRYEEIQGLKADFEEKWKIVAYDELGFPITSYEARSVKNRAMPWICGGGCLLLGALPIALLTMVIGGGSPSGEGDMNWTAGSIVIISGVAGSILAGSVLGNKISNHGAVNKVKESRKLRTVEKR